MARAEVSRSNYFQGEPEAKVDSAAGAGGVIRRLLRI